MELKIKHIVLTTAFCLFSLTGFSQFSQHPPEPMAQDAGDDWRPCGEDGEGDQNTPPPGLCMPIDDHIFPLMVLGLIFGAYKMYKIGTPRKPELQ